MRLEERISDLLTAAAASCNEWIEPTLGGDLNFIDPHDGQEISGHYGASHIAVAHILIGRIQNDTSSYDKGILLLQSVLEKWEENARLKEFHFDFNNFALCVAEEYLTEDQEDLRRDIRQVVIETVDSNHDTINWLPMRMYVNKMRYLWTHEEHFQKNVMACSELISLATNSDGGIEDRLPKGKSFNLQYNVATLALLQFVNCRGGELNISRELGFLIHKVLPDGDINYQGRGANQFFAWGMWIYLLSSTGRTRELEQALNYLTEKLVVALRNKNIMLNDWQGKEKYLWWDYHYCSVYTAHLVFWLAMALQDYCTTPVDPVFSDKCTTGLSVRSNPKFFSVGFEGRSEYLAEKGPLLSALWIDSYGTLFKSIMGPWLGQFGNKYMEEGVLRNYLGLIEIEPNYNFQGNRVLRRIYRYINTRQNVTIRPLFAEYSISMQEDAFVITFINPSNRRAVFNLPMLEHVGDLPEFSLTMDGRPSTLKCNLKIRNQYDWCKVFESEASTAREWVLIFK